jgi:hypothetical protein
MKTRDERRRLRARAKSKDKAFGKLPPSEGCGCKGGECDWCFFTSRGASCKYMRNPRKEFGISTEQEQRAKVDEMEQRKELKCLNAVEDVTSH